MISFDNDVVLIHGQLRCHIFDISFRAISLEAPAIVRPTIPTISCGVVFPQEFAGARWRKTLLDADKEDRSVFHSTHSFSHLIQITWIRSKPIPIKTLCWFFSSWQQGFICGAPCSAACVEQCSYATRLHNGGTAHDLSTLNQHMNNKSFLFPQGNQFTSNQIVLGSPPSPLSFLLHTPI